MTARGHDAELDALFEDDPGLLDLSERMRASRPEPDLDPRYKAVLRARILDAAERELRQPVLLRRPWFLRGGALTFGGTAFGTAMIAAAVATVILYHPHDTSQFDLQGQSTASGVARLDPQDVIRVSFNAPMNEDSVVRALTIRPATSITTSWSGNTLTITPVHHLAANTAYTVTVDHTVARDAAGRAPASDVRIPFGTAPTPTPGARPTSKPAPKPVFTVTQLGASAARGHLDIGADGAVVTGTAISAPTTSALNSASPNAPVANVSNPSTPGAIGASAPAAVSPAEGPTITRYSGSTTAKTLTRGGGGIASSPDGRLIAALIPKFGGGASLIAIDADGGTPATLDVADSPDGPLAWSAPDTITYVGGRRIRSVDLQGHSRTLTADGVEENQVVVLAAQGRVAYVGPSASQPIGRIIDLTTLQNSPLPGATNQVVFSGDGTRIAWVDHSQQTARVLVAQVSDPTKTTTVATLAGGDSVTGFALSIHGRRLVVAHANGAVRAVEVATDTLLASTTLTLDGDIVWAPSGDRIALIRHDVAGDAAVVAALPGTDAVQPLPDTVPAGASATLNRLIDNQVHGRDLTADLAAGVDPSGLKVATLSRAFVIRHSLRDDGTVTAQVRLVADAHETTGVRFADESVVLSRSSGSWLVTSATVGHLQDEVAGPHVVHVSSDAAGPTTTLQAAFDSDLDPASIPGAVSVHNADGSVVDASTTYDANTRTITAVVNDAGGVPLQLVLSAQLRDVAGQHLAGEFRSSTRG